ncbi:MAG: TolC family protein [Caulobacteraceae bacterium]|nr:TolC family protein [Caulobacteraceae bacterium]
MISPRAVERWVAAAGLSALLAGCLVGPTYKTPAPLAPPTQAFVSPASPAVSLDQPPPDWWRLYDTPALNQLVQAALVHNTSLQAAAADLAQARAALDLARANRFPTTALSAGAQYGVSSNAQLVDQLEHRGPASPGAYYETGLDVSYEVDLFGRIRRGVQAAKADYQAQAAAEDAARVSVAGETTRAYLDACAYAEELGVAQNSLDVAEQTYQVTLKQAKDGTASDFDVARAREAAERIRASLPAFDAQHRVALFQLSVLTGRPPEAVSEAAAACAVPPKLTSPLPVGDIQSLFKRRPDVREAERRLAADVARVGVATADFYPTITLGASGATAGSKLSQLGAPAYVNYLLGPLLNWSFPNTLVALGEIRQARAAASGDYANFEGAVLQALQDAEDALTTYDDELKRNAALDAARDQSQTAFKLAQERYRLGSIAYLDLLTAQSDLVSASADLAASDQALVSDQVTVFKALGGGWQQAPAISPPSVRDWSQK